MAALTVKKLREFLKNFDDDTILVLSSDGEGNSYSPIPEKDFFSVGTYLAENTWRGEFYDENSEDEDDEEEYDEEDEGVRCIVLWPTN
jgi:hypothetical protein